MSARILGIGAATWDYFYTVVEFPSGEGVVQAKQATQCGGGPVATALCVLAQAGNDCTLVDVQGDDAVGHAIRSDLQAHGINLHAIEILPQAISAQAYIMVRQGDGARHIAYLPMAANEPAWPRVENLLQQHWDLLYLNGRHEGVAQAAAQIAVRHSLPIAFDGGAGRYRPSLRPLVQASRLLIVAQEFAQRYVGKALTPEELGPLLLKDAAQVVVITAGIHGSHVWSQAGDYFHQSAYSAQPLVDTTGCGDVYHGAFTAGWLKQLPLRTVAEHASRLAAKTAEGLGGRWALLPVKSR